MKINAIDAVNFGTKQKAAKTLVTMGAGAIMGSTFVKGLSKPDTRIDNDVFIKANDAMGNEDCEDSYEECCSVECQRECYRGSDDCSQGR